MEAGATLDLTTQTLTATGSMSANGLIAGANGWLVMTGVGSQLRGNLGGVLRVDSGGEVSLDDDTDVAGRMDLRGPLLVGGHSLTVGGDVTVSGSYDGALVMDDPAALVQIGGGFDVRSDDGVFTAGRLEVAGDFRSSFSTGAYSPSGTHLTVLNGDSAQTVRMFQGHFNDLQIANTDPLEGVVFSSSGGVNVQGSLEVVNGSKLTGSGTLLVDGEVSAPADSEIRVGTLGIGGPSGTTLIEGTLAPETLALTGTDQTITVGTNVSYTNVTAAGPGTTFDGQVSLAGELYVDAGGELVLAGDTDVGGAMDLRGPLLVGGHSLTVGGHVTASGSYDGALVMDDPAALVQIGGGFDVRSDDGVFTAGRLEVAGDFRSSFSTGAYSPSGTHLTVLNGDSAQTVRMFQGHFNDLQIANTDTQTGVTFSTGVFVSGNLSHASGIWNVELDTTTTIQGDLTLSSGVTLNNDGTVEYGGTFTDNGATINGNAPQPISP